LAFFLGARVKIFPENWSRAWNRSLIYVLFRFVTMIFVGFTASQQESNRSVGVQHRSRSQIFPNRIGVGAKIPNYSNFIKCNMTRKK